MVAMSESEASCLTYVAPGKAEIHLVSAAMGKPEDDCVAMRALWSGISRGTERLVFNGQVPESEYQRMRGPFQRGDFPFPVAYGYAWVGVPNEEDSVSGEVYFGLLPHQDRLIVPRAALVRLPIGLDPRRAVLAANMETALNVVWDAAVGPGDHVAVVGGGVLGSLIAGIVSDIVATKVTLVDVNEGRREVAGLLGADFALPDEAKGEQDAVIHTSASEAGVATALRLAGTESTVVEASWHGTASPRLPLGGAFHSKRLTLRSSQVGQLSPSRRPRWSHRRRLEAALDLLRNDKYDAVITGEASFSALPERISTILDPKADGLATAVSYL